MSPKKINAIELRQQAEEKLGKQKKTAASTTEAETLRLVHELQVHQIELEMQNEELIQTQAESEESYRQYTDLYDFAPMGYFMLGQDGTVRKVNLAGANLLGVERGELIKRRLGLFVSDESRPAFNSFFDKLLAGEGKITCELIFEKKEDEPLWTRLEATSFEGGQECLVVMMDISERKQAEKLIRQYASELEKRVQERTAQLVHANQAKDEFLATMSHELRTPLNGILGYSEILLEGVHGSINQKQSQAVEIIYSSGQHLLGLINDILDVSKIESGKFELHLENVSVDSICQSSLVFIKQLALKKSIAVKYSPPLSAPTIFADPMRLKQILVNLLNNAVKFTPEHGSVKLEAREDTQMGQIQFSITDSGIGIPPEDQQKLFKSFVQLDSSLSRQYEGSGLGLSLVKQLVEMHGGNVGVESEAGKGSCFHFTISTRSGNHRTA